MHKMPPHPFSVDAGAGDGRINGLVDLAPSVPEGRMDGGSRGGLTIASASSPRSMPSVAKRAIRSRPVIGSPVSVRPAAWLPPAQHIGCQARGVDTEVAP